MSGGLKVDIRGQRGTLLLDVAFDADVGVTALVGPSGSGKTSVLRAIAGLWKPEHGSISIGNNVVFEAGEVTVPAHLRGVGCVFQSPVLFPHMTVRQNLEYGYRAGDVDRDELVRVFDLQSLENRRPRHLSGGEAQRVALARALLTQPRVVLLDEPLTGLDRALRETIMPYQQKIPDLLQVPIVYVSHSETEVLHLAQQVVMIDSGKIIGKMSVKDFAEMRAS